MTDLVPNACIGLSTAIWYLSNRFDPDLWQEPAQNTCELRLWHAIRQYNDLNFLAKIGFCYSFYNEPLPDGVSLRLESYFHAEKRLRQALFADKFKAYFISAAEQTAGKVYHILPESWGTDAGQMTLRNGRADVQGEPWERTVFLDVFPFRTHFFSEEETATRAVENTQVAASFVVGKPLKPRGRPPGYDWLRARTLVFQLLDHHGLPDPNDPELPTQAMLERRVAELLTTSERSPSASVVRSHVARFMEEFLNEREAEK